MSCVISSIITLVYFIFLSGCVTVQKITKELNTAIHTKSLLTTKQFFYTNHIILKTSNEIITDDSFLMEK